MPLITRPAAGQIVDPAWGTLVADAVVMRFATAAQRASQLTAPVVNQLTQLDTAPGAVEYWNGSAWVLASGGSWASYTPALWGDTAAGAIGSGSIVGRWRYLGEKTVAVAVKFTAGTGTTYNAGAQRMTLPVQAAASITNALVGTAAVMSIAGIFSGYALVAADRNYMQFSAPISLTSPEVKGITNTNLNTSSLIICTGTYETA